MANERHKEQEILSKNNPMFSVYRRFEGYRISTIAFAERPKELESLGFEREITMGTLVPSLSVVQSANCCDNRSSST